MWNKLSMKDRAKYIKLGVANGVKDLNTIRDAYNKYAKGGPIDEEDEKYNTIQEKLYKNITPFGYHSPIKRVYDAVVRDKQDSYREDENTRINKENPESSALDAIWATYLNIPLSKRRYVNPYYAITKTPQGYYRFKDPRFIIDFDLALDEDGLYSKDNRQDIFMNTILGNHTIGLGRDEKGDYIYYSDSRLNNDGTPNIKTGWDINPFSKTTDSDTTESTEEVGQYGQNKKSLSYKVGKFLFGDIEDLSFGIGTPVPIYDKIYLDDYYGLPNEDRAFYLPEVRITPK